MSGIIAGYIYEGSGLKVREEDLKKLTHLNLAFGLLQEDGSIRTDHLDLACTIASYRAVHPGLKVLLSIGSGHPAAFSGGASTAARRKKIAASCAAFVREHGLDGIDYDWEYPCCPSNRILASPADRENFTLLCAEIRAALDAAADRRILFTLAAGGGAYYTDFTQMDLVAQYTDYIFLMTYDFRCGFHTLTGHHTNLFRSTGDLFRTSCRDAVADFLAARVPAGKLVLGAAFYSRRWLNVPDSNHGFLQYAPCGGGYGPDYTTITASYLNQNGFVRYWDDEAKAPWLFDGSTFITYDDPTSIAAKGAYARRLGLAGMFFWEYNGDASGVLLDAIHRSLS